MIETATSVMVKQRDSADTSILPHDPTLVQILTPDPTSLSFDYCMYGGLTSSVFQRLQDYGLENLVADSTQENAEISLDTGTTRFKTANCNDEFNNLFDVNFLAMEVHTDGDRSIFALGLYIGPKEKQTITSSENIMVQLEDTTQRDHFLKTIDDFARKLSKINLPYGGNGTTPKYLAKLLKSNTGARLITEEEFNQNPGLFFDNVQNPFNRQTSLILDDCYGQERHHPIYAIWLSSFPHNRNNKFHYRCGFFMQDDQYESFDIPIAEKTPLVSHESAFRLFQNMRHETSRRICEQAGFPDYDSSDPRMEHRYIRFALDKDSLPIVLRYGVSSFNQRDLLPQERGYIELIGPDASIRLYEGIHYDPELNPYGLIQEIAETLSTINFGNGSYFRDRNNMPKNPAHSRHVRFLLETTEIVHGLISNK